MRINIVFQIHDPRNKLKKAVSTTTKKKYGYHEFERRIGKDTKLARSITKNSIISFGQNLITFYKI